MIWDRIRRDGLVWTEMEWEKIWRKCNEMRYNVKCCDEMGWDGMWCDVI